MSLAFLATAPPRLTQFSDEQIHALVQNTEHFGGGLIVLGGPNSYGAGGWANTELEKALPVDCQIKNAKVNAIGALMLVIDSSGSMNGEKIAWSKAAAIAASQMLGERDFIGVVTFDSEPHWIVPIQRNATRERTQSANRSPRRRRRHRYDARPPRRIPFDPRRGRFAQSMSSS